MLLPTFAKYCALWVAKRISIIKYGSNAHVVKITKKLIRFFGMAFIHKQYPCSHKCRKLFLLNCIIKWLRCVIFFMAIKCWENRKLQNVHFWNIYYLLMFMILPLNKVISAVYNLPWKSKLDSHNLSTLFQI